MFQDQDRELQARVYLRQENAFWASGSAHSESSQPRTTQPEAAKLGGWTATTQTQDDSQEATKSDHYRSRYSSSTTEDDFWPSSRKWFLELFLRTTRQNLTKLGGPWELTISQPSTEFQRKRPVGYREIDGRVFGAPFCGGGVCVHPMSGLDSATSILEGRNSALHYKLRANSSKTAKPLLKSHFSRV